ncbi:hypothetical protein H9N25_00740 [Pedobacter riviphilus]|uniref:Uncharacterized protein n=1 Tax=Pedobacter riviphilus TaxID=2766984 RepID=A0ABX6TIP6_9SPHI|nr:hypothetical protein [Pedobacter riviphilus]QNR85071.1 hypothetical protein H9N25_00740 [Pedobacter riviphilus]
MNSYYKDSFIFFREACSKMDENITKEVIIQISLNLALGFERLLKGILVDKNPIFILVDPSFENSFKALFQDLPLYVKDNKKTPEKDGNQDTITFRTSVIRAKSFSKIVLGNESKLFAISKARDIIAHSELKYLDLNLLESIIKVDFINVIEDFSKELEIPLVKFVGGNKSKLSKISILSEKNLFLKIDKLIAHHKSVWEEHKNHEGYVTKQKKVTSSLALSKYTGTIKCPACLQTAIVQLKPISEYDSFLEQNILLRYDVTALICKFCKLNTRDLAILNALGIPNESINKACVSCEDRLTSNESGICNDCEKKSNDLLWF